MKDIAALLTIVASGHGRAHCAVTDPTPETLEVFPRLLALNARRMHCLLHPPVSHLLIENRNYLTDSISVLALATWKLKTKFLAQA